MSILGVALLMAAMIAGISVRGTLAQSEPDVHGVCKSVEREIQAEELSGGLNLEGCISEDKVIVDNGVGSVVPAPGRGVAVEAIGPSGVQEFAIERHRDGSIELAGVGDETSEPSESSGAAFAPLASDPAPCSDRAYDDSDSYVEGRLGWHFNRSSTPKNLSPGAALRAIRSAGTNVSRVRDACGVRDRVSAWFPYENNYKSGADIGSSGACKSDDGKSEVTFGDLGRSSLAVECKWYVIKKSGYDETKKSDVKLNKKDFRWTTRPKKRSCRKAYDIQAVMTHERGHTLGLAHVSERGHGRLTMSTKINGPCQKAERTLGRGDAIGLNRKYR